MMDFKFDLQHFAVQITTGGESLGVGSKVTVSAASGVTAFAESVGSGFKFGSSSSAMNSTVQVAGDSDGIWGATLNEGPVLGNLNSISGGAVVWGDIGGSTITTDTAGTFKIGSVSTAASSFTITGDSSVTFTLDENAAVSNIGDFVSGTLQAAAGTYTVNGSTVTIASGEALAVDENGSVVTVFDKSAVNDDTSADTYAKAIVTGDAAAVTTSSAALDSAISTALSGSSVDASALDGDLAATIPTASDTSTTQSLDFSSSTGKKNITINNTANLSLTFNSSGGNTARIGKEATGSAKVTFGGGGDYAAIAATTANISLAGSGDNTVMSAGTNVTYDLSSAGDGTRFGVANKGRMKLFGYNPLRGGAAIITGFANALTGFLDTTASKMRLVNGKLFFGSAYMDFGTGSSDLADSADLAESADATTTNGAVVFRDDTGNLVGVTNYEADSKVDLSSTNEDVTMVGNLNGQHNQGTRSTLISGDGNDVLAGGDGDVLFGGTGYNTFNLQSSGTSELGAQVVLSTVTGTASEHAGEAIDRVTGFQSGFDAGKDIIVADLTSSSIALDSTGNLVVASGKNTLTVETVSSSGVADVLVSDVAGGTAQRVEVAAAGSTMSVSSGNLAAYYAGNGSVFDLSGFSSSTYVNLNDQTATANSGTAVVKGISTLVGGSGTSSLYGSAADEVIQAGTGRTSVWGGAGNDSLVSNANASTEFGFLAGDGRDSISGFTGMNESANYDVLYAQQTYAGVSADGSNVIVALNSDDVLTIENGVGKDIAVEYNGEAYVGKVGNASVSHDGVAGYYYAASSDASVVASNSSMANIWLGSESFKTDSANYEGDFKYLSASGVTKNATLAGNSNDNYIVGGSAANSVWGGSSTSNDTLVAGSGTNTFFYGVDGNTNEGSDLIVGAGSKDTVRLLNLSVDDITNGSASVSVSSGAVEVNFTGGGSLTLNSNSGTTFALNDGSSWTYDKSASTWKQK